MGSMAIIADLKVKIFDQPILFVPSASFGNSNCTLYYSYRYHRPTFIFNGKGNIKIR